MPMFLPFLGVLLTAIGLLKLGAMSVMVNVLSTAIAVLLIVIVGLVVVIAFRYIKKP